MLDGACPVIESDLLTVGWRIVSFAAALAVVFVAARGIPWREWRERSHLQNVYLGSLTGVGLVWTMQAGITADLSMHFLLVTTLTLMHGWRLAVIGITVILAAMAIAGQIAPAAIPVNLLCVGLVPIAVTSAIYRLVEARLPNNYFVYFFVTVFAGSAVAFNAAGLARLFVLLSSGAPVSGHIGPEFVVWIPMMSFAEAFLNGMLMAIFVVYRPEWVASFDDRKYLRRR
ncbi:MAG TPA: energy-coupling factor ABC transporter permease [Steroidobacteraceae bacterium]|nr:energy-coupling factor ABC transporter permease [Steroidobacteraceae bacterium]